MAARTISVSLPEGHVKLVERAAKREKRTRSEAIRHAIDVAYGRLRSRAGTPEAQAKLSQGIVMEMLRSGTISSGRAAELLGVTKWEILDLMGEYGIVLLDGDEETLRREMEVLGFPGGREP